MFLLNKSLFILNTSELQKCTNTSEHRVTLEKVDADRCVGAGSRGAEPRGGGAAGVLTLWMGGGKNGPTPTEVLQANGAEQTRKYRR